jgi:hypothetical protein
MTLAEKPGVDLGSFLDLLTRFALRDRAPRPYLPGLFTARAFDVSHTEVFAICVPSTLGNLNTAGLRGSRCFPYEENRQFSETSRTYVKNPTVEK